MNCKNKVEKIVLLLIATVLPWQFIFLSFAEIALITVWIFCSSTKQKFTALRNPSVAALFAFFVLHVISLKDGVNQQAIKYLYLTARIIYIPIIILTFKPNKKILSVFIFVLNISISSKVLFFLFTKLLGIDIAFSTGISHIRLAMLINIAIFSAIFFIKKYDTYTNKQKNILLLLIPINSLAILLAMSVSGIIFFIVFSYIFLYYFNKKYRLLINTFAITLFTAFFLYTKNIINLFIEGNNIVNPQEYTINGNKYTNDTSKKLRENGNLIWINVCEKEIEKEWNNVSRIKYNMTDKKGNLIKYTIIRYLTSKSLSKDSVGISKLTANDITNIENGIANVRYTQKYNPLNYVYRIVWEIDRYIRTGNPNDKSVAQRIEFLKNGLYLMKKNKYLGTGIGNFQEEITKTYTERKSKLKKNRRLLTHNQYLAILIQLGIFMGGIAIILLFAPVFFNVKNINILNSVILIILFVSMIYEDLFFTQQGIFIFSFFYSSFFINPVWTKE